MMAVGLHASVDKNEDNNHVEEWHMSHDVTLFHITSDMLFFALQGTQLARNMPNHVKHHHYFKHIQYVVPLQPMARIPL